MSICNSTNFLTFSNPISLNKTFSCKLILSLKISRRKVFIIKEDNSCVKLCWKIYWSQDVLSPVGYSQTKDVFIMYSTYWEILTKKLCHKFAYANEFEPIRGAKMVFTYEKKKIRPIRIATMFFFEKWYVQSEATEVCEFSAKIPAIYRRLQLRRHAMRKVFFKEFFF